MDLTYERSMAHYARATRVIAGGSLTRSKAPGRFSAIGEGPLYNAGRSEGAYCYDADGRRYIDMLCALGAVTLGHGYVGASPCSLSSLPDLVEAEAAEAMLSTVAPWASQCRFVKTGSEATMGAYLVARASTGRKHVFVGAESYHGWTGPWATGDFCHRYAHHVDFDSDEFCRLIDLEQIAAVFVEPYRWLTTSPEWYLSVRRFCDRIGALMVMDEMIYGLRWHVGGATGLYGLKPDLACYGKALGDGAPIACIVGGDALASYGQLISGTHSGERSALNAVVAVLQTYRSEPVIEVLWKRGRQLQDGLRALVDPSIAIVDGAPVHQRLRFLDPRVGGKFSAAMARRGVLHHPDVINICYAHTDAQIDYVREAARQTLKELAL